MSIDSNAPAISINDLQRVFEPSPAWLRLLIKSSRTSSVTALDSVSFEVNEGEICALVGPNGAGKTTLFRIMVGLTTPTAGSAKVLGMDVVTQSLEIRRRVGWMPTGDQTLFQRHSVSQNLRFHGRMYGLSGARAEKAIDETLEMVDLAHVKNDSVVSLSTGMSARLRLARALLHRPDLLILDEPTSSVDPVASLVLVNLIKSIVSTRGMSAILSSHRLDEIEALRSHVLLLHQGSVLFDGALDSLKPKLSRQRFEVTFASSSLASDAHSLFLLSPNVDGASLKGSMINVTLAHETPIGPVMAGLGLQLQHVVSISEVEVPLREVLAEAYGIADANQGDQ